MVTNVFNVIITVFFVLCRNKRIWILTWEMVVFAPPQTITAVVMYPTTDP